MYDCSYSPILLFYFDYFFAVYIDIFIYHNISLYIYSLYYSVFIYFSLLLYSHLHFELRF